MTNLIHLLELKALKPEATHVYCVPELAREFVKATGTPVVLGLKIVPIGGIPSGVTGGMFLA